MKRLVVLLAILFVGQTAWADIVVYHDESAFQTDWGPFDVFLNFRFDASGTEHYPASYSARSGDYFSDDVTFSSLDASDPRLVLWGHFDGDDGGIGPAPALVGRLELDFVVPTNAVGFRNPGWQPGMHIQFFDSEGMLLGEIRDDVVSFIGAASTDAPIAYVIMEMQGFNQFAITALRFNRNP